MKLHKLILLTALVSQGALAEGVYTWKDENGRVHFSDKSPSPKARQIAAPAGKKPAFSADDLVGNWAIEGSRNGVTMRTVFALGKDGNFSGEVTANGKSFMTYSGTWELAGDRINWLYTKTSVPLPPDAMKDADRIISISPSRIDIISVKSGENRALIRQ